LNPYPPLRTGPFFQLNYVVIVNSDF
jgi:hypothetical protein